VRDYTVTYAEDVPDQYISAPSLPLYQGPSVQQSGVIVVSESRNIWEVSTSARELAFSGETTVVLGDATWRETVYINRTEWRVSGGNTTYKVYGRHGEEPRRELFASDPALADPILNDSRIQIRPTAEFYEIAVFRGGTLLGTAEIPADDQNVTLGGIDFERDGRALVARTDGTELQIAEYRLGRRE
jgi:hypothetical protein